MKNAKGTLITYDECQGSGIRTGDYTKLYEF